MKITVVILLLTISLLGVTASYVLPGWRDLILIAGPSAFAAFILLVWTVVRRRKPSKVPSKWGILDGSNVMHWKDGAPGLQAVQDVVIALQRRGYGIGVVFDANAGYLLTGRYQHDKLALRLSLPRDNVLVVHKGEPADPRILTMARDMGAVVVTNDRYRDWDAQFPEVRKPGHLVRGGYRDGTLWRDLPDG
ncbi:NYN domain-containing protein [Jannaschia donghaensis]|uniref:Zc3h12a-like Ribonuclease NYN domain protein n=1 Tax=Jannaschia donghaensis TaxID=420998 RepID=A0A0M6YF69_9RHOB|nr:hypothetical protein [Jannaschia donghaensis]CTQ48584.1 Zc3h12a-like Ribonuclease NYN domain protein [Jannaschia donghaensis]